MDGITSAEQFIVLKEIFPFKWIDASENETRAKANRKQYFVLFLFEFVVYMHSTKNFEA